MSFVCVHVCVMCSVHKHGINVCYVGTHVLGVHVSVHMILCICVCTCVCAVMHVGV